MTLNQNPKLLDDVSFNVKFATDEELKSLLFAHYFLEDWVYSDEMTMTVMLQMKANLIRHVYDKLYETTIINYDPLENYNVIEEHIKDTYTKSFEDRKDSTTVKPSNDYKSSLTTNNYEYPIEPNEPKQTNKTVNDTTLEGSITTENSYNGKEINDHAYESKKHGNIGVITNQDMIKKERELIIHIEEQYIAEFEDYFMLPLD